MRLYLNNNSYPELRDLTRRWSRTGLWWRAIWRATGAPRFWLFLVVQALVLIATLAVDAWLFERVPPTWVSGSVQLAVLLGGLAIFAYLQASWGGDMMRSHLRAISETARYACPCCGQSLYGHLRDDTPTVQCPECATNVERRVFEPPFPIPREFRVFPPWGGRGPT